VLDNERWRTLVSSHCGPGEALRASKPRASARLQSQVMVDVGEPLPGCVVLRRVLSGPTWILSGVFRQDVFQRPAPNTFVQLNHSRSAKKVLRGLHFQSGRLWES
jgi:hypothetical protein